MLSDCLAPIEEAPLSAAEPIHWDPYDLSLVADPYPTYQR